MVVGLAVWLAHRIAHSLHTSIETVFPSTSPAPASVAAACAADWRRLAPSRAGCTTSARDIQPDWRIVPSEIGRTSNSPGGSACKPLRSQGLRRSPTSRRRSEAGCGFLTSSDFTGHFWRLEREIQCVGLATRWLQPTGQADPRGHPIHNPYSSAPPETDVLLRNRCASRPPRMAAGLSLPWLQFERDPNSIGLRGSRYTR